MIKQKMEMEETILDLDIYSYKRRYKRSFYFLPKTLFMRLSKKRDEDSVYKGP